MFQASLRLGPLCISILLAIPSLSCSSSEAPPEQSVGSSNQAIIDGIGVAVDTIGTPDLGHTAGGYCSSTLLSDGWLLTANHCITQVPEAPGGAQMDPTQLRIRLKDGEWINGNSSWTIYQHPTLDVALVNFNQSITDGSAKPFGNPLYLGQSSQLVGKSVYCQSWGKGTRDTGGETLRYGWIPVARLASNGFFFENVRPIPWHGDSGGSCFVYANGQWNIVSVNSLAGVDGCTNDDETCRYWSFAVGVEYFRDWVQGIVGNSAVVFANQFPDSTNVGGPSQQLLPGGPRAVADTAPASHSEYDYPQMTIGNDTIRAIFVPHAWTVHLFEDYGFGGRDWSYGESYWEALSAEVDQQASSAKVYGGVVTSAGVVYGSGGSYSLAGKSWDNGITSLRVPAGWIVSAFDVSNASGDSATYTEGTYNTLGNMASRVSGLRILEPAAVYPEEDFAGAVSYLTSDCYDIDRMGLPNDAISSIYVPPLRAIQAFWNGGLSGYNTIYGAGQKLATLDAWNNQISGLCVYSFPARLSGKMVGGDALSNIGNGAFESSIWSPNRKYRLVMQTDGNLVVYQGSTPLWSSCTNTSGGQIATLQPDGNFVVYDSNHYPLWSSNTNGQTGAYLQLDNDGVLRIYQGTTAIWTSSTNCL